MIIAYIALSKINVLSIQTSAFVVYSAVIWQRSNVNWFLSNVLQKNSLQYRRTTKKINVYDMNRRKLNFLEKIELTRYKKRCSFHVNLIKVKRKNIELLSRNMVDKICFSFLKNLQVNFIALHVAFQIAYLDLHSLNRI